MENPVNYNKRNITTSINYDAEATKEIIKINIKKRRRKEKAHILNSIVQS